MFCIYLRTNSDLCHLQHKLIGFYNPDEKCLQRGTDWVLVQIDPLATEAGISLIILTPMKILQRNLNSSTFVV